MRLRSAHWIAQPQARWISPPRPARSPVPAYMILELLLSAALAIPAAETTLVKLHATLPRRSAASLYARGLIADSLVLVKSTRQLTLYAGGTAVHTYPVALGQHPVGAKERAGDERTPEGLYYIDGRNPHSRYHLSLHISYPDERDRTNAAKLGVDPGGEIMIHGLPPGLGDIGELHLLHNWTDGCVALTNEQIEELWRFVPDGVPIHIKP